MSGSTVVADLVDEIRAQHEAGKRWRLSAEDLQRLLGLTPAQYLQEIYAAELGGDRLVTLSAATERFAQGNVRQLVALLEHLCGAGVVPALERAGVFFSYDEQAELMAVFLAAAAAAVTEHSFETDTFIAMLKVFGTVPHARAAYLEHHFDLTQLRRTAAETYCAAKTFALPELAVANAEELLQFLFAKHVLREANLFAPLHERFMAAARSAGYAQERQERQERGKRGARQPEPRSVLQAARRTMGLESEPVSLADLKARYKDLMKQYHPDVNPEGLARCQEINAAYSELVAVAR